MTVNRKDGTLLILGACTLSTLLLLAVGYVAARILADAMFRASFLG